MPNIFLVNPSITSLGYGLIAPRWLFVIARATPREIGDDPIIIDEQIRRFRASEINPGDIVGIGITTGNCSRGYKIIKEAKERGAIVLVGGIHATIFPNEPLEFGADGVITGNGDLVWPEAVKDALKKTVRKKYVGGRVSGDRLLSARWELMDKRRYLTAAVQTVVGCPENCSFCSVWVTDGQVVRQRLTDKVISEVNQLYSMGFRYILFADDNFNPATLGRIKRELNPEKRKELEQIREARLRFFEEYSKSVPGDIYGFTQMTSELAGDREYLEAMYEKMRIRGGLIGVESFSEVGLKSANKQWNPVGEKMVKAINLIQNRGIVVLSSVICGLASDTLESLESMREFTLNSGTNLAQFIIYSPYPGTVDFSKMTRAGTILYDKFWLDPNKPAVLFKHSSLNAETIITETGKSWQSFYSLSSIMKRTRSLNWPWQQKFWYFLASIAFRHIYAKDGISADSVRSQRTAVLPAMLMRITVSVFNSWLKNKNKPMNPA